MVVSVMQLDHHLGELNCLVSTFPVNLYFPSPSAPEPGPGEEEGAAKSEEGIRIVPPTNTFGAGGAGVVGILLDWIFKIRGMVADNGIEALDLIGGRGVIFSFSSLVCLGTDTRRVISFTGRAGRTIGDYHQLFPISK